LLLNSYIFSELEISMIKKRTMTINLNDAEMSILEDICEKKGLSKTALIRQAIRLYQSLDTRIDAGGKLYVEDALSKEKSELLVL